MGPQGDSIPGHRSIADSFHRPAATSSGSRSAFTLVEMLVSIAVLVLIMTFIGQMMNSVSLSTTLSSKHIDTDNQARLIFDRMAMDFAGMPHRSDIEFIFSKQGSITQDASVTSGSSDKMFFYSEAPAYFSSSISDLYPSATATTTDPKSPMSLIGYCVNTGSDNTGTYSTTSYAPPAFCLQRLSKGLTWDSSIIGGPGGMTFFTFDPNYAPTAGFLTPVPGSTFASGTFSAAVGAPPDYAGSDPSFDTFGTLVFRMEFCFEVKDLSSPGHSGTVFSNFPVAEFTDTNTPTNATGNKTTIMPTPGAGGGSSDNDPPTTLANATTTYTVGDRWYNAYDNRAFMCTGYTNAIPTSATAPPVRIGYTWAPIGLSDVSAIVVAIAVMDTNSRKILTQIDLGKLASRLVKFPEPSSPSEYSSTSTLMASTWEAMLNTQPNPIVNADNIPPLAVSQVRVYQRFFYLNNN